MPGRTEILRFAKKHPEVIEVALRDLCHQVFLFDTMATEILDLLKEANEADAQKVIEDHAKARTSLRTTLNTLTWWLEAYRKAPHVAQARARREHERMPTAWAHLLKDETP